MESCQSFCQKFHPVKYDPMLEGELDKLYALDGFLKRRMRKLHKKRERELKMEENNGRILDYAFEYSVYMLIVTVQLQC